jgi:hypothetical protein
VVAQVTYPADVPTTEDFYLGKNDRTESTLSVALDPADMTVTLADASRFLAGKSGLNVVSAAGVVEFMYVSGRTGNVFTVTTRGAAGTTPGTFGVGTRVFQSLLEDHHQVVALNCRNSLVELGTEPSGSHATVKARLEWIESQITGTNELYEILLNGNNTGDRGILWDEVTSPPSPTSSQIATYAEDDSGTTLFKLQGGTLYVDSTSAGEDGIAVVQASSSHSPRIRIENDAGDYMHLIMGKSSGAFGYINLSGNYPFRIDNNNATIRLLHISADGKTGLGNNGSPSYMLDVFGDIAVRANDAIRLDSDGSDDTVIYSDDAKITIEVNRGQTWDAGHSNIEFFNNDIRVYAVDGSRAILSLFGSDPAATTTGGAEIRLDNDTNDRANIRKRASADPSYPNDLTISNTSARLVLVNTPLFLDSGSAYMDLAEIGDPGSPSADRARIYAEEYEYASAQTALVFRDTMLHLRKAANGAVVLETDGAFDPGLVFAADGGARANWNVVTQSSGSLHFINNLGTVNQILQLKHIDGSTMGRIEVGGALPTPLFLSRMTTVQRDNMSAPSNADIFYNTTTVRTESREGGTFGALGRNAIDGAPQNVPITSPGQTVFTLLFTPVDDAQVQVYVNGQQQTPTTDYTVSGTTLTWLDTDFTLETDDELRVVPSIAA